MPAPGPNSVADTADGPSDERPDRPAGPSVEAGQRFELTVDRAATGGAAIGAGPDGRIVFVPDAIPGERVTVDAAVVHRNRIEATLVDVVEASGDRVEPTCPHVAQGCGGCDWQHVAADRQAALRRDIVADCLRRLAKIDDVEITPGPTLPVDGYRTTVRAAVVDGRAAYRLRGSHDTVTIDSCGIAHPLVEELLVDGRFGSASEVVVRAGANTGERLVVVDPTTDGVVVPDGVKLVGVDELDAGARPHYHEELVGLRLQISARSFFQCRPDGALLLAEMAGDAVADAEGALLDGYCGVGLFGAVSGIGRQVIAVESDPSAVADATWNLRPHGRVINERFERWTPEPVGAAIVDPARAGLKAEACDRLVETGAELVALISCDPASLARDASLLAERGYTLDRVTVFDLFGHTSHIETLSRFVRA
ncbi:MAG: TRAM domain-containing protein [Actinomycetota bacterium]